MKRCCSAASQAPGFDVGAALGVVVGGAEGITQRALVAGVVADAAVDGQACRLMSLCLCGVWDKDVVSVVAGRELGENGVGRTRGNGPATKESRPAAKVVCGLVQCPPWTRLGVMTIDLVRSACLL